MADTPTVHDLKPDPENANRGTERGREILTESVEECGWGRGAVSDKQKNAKIRTVHTDGNTLVVVQRVDLDLRTQPKARKLSYYDNRSSELGLRWDAERIQLDRESGVDLTMAFFPEELSGFKPVETPVALRSPVPGLPDDGSIESVESPTERSIKAKHNAKKRHERVDQQYRMTVYLPLETLEARANWTTFHKALKARYPDIERPGDRLMMYLQETEGI
jgi:hypothetical protein